MVVEDSNLCFSLVSPCDFTEISKLHTFNSQVKPTKTFYSFSHGALWVFLLLCVDFLTVAHWAAVLIGVKGR